MMKQAMRNILESSFVYRFFAAIFSWFGAQWRESRIICRFLSPGKGKAASESSIFSRVWLSFHRLLCKVFEKLRLNKLFHGSIFAMPLVWSSLTLVLAPLLPTMAIIGLTLVSIISLILAFGCDSERRPAYSPANKYILLFAFVYITATLTSVSVSGSLQGGALTTLFVLFAIVLQNSVVKRRQLDILTFILVISGAAVSAYGILQYLLGVTGASSWIDSEMFSEIGVRVYSTLDNPNMLAAYLLLVIPFSGACILVAKRPVVKLFYACCLGAMLLCMILTFARGAWLGLIVAVAVFLVMMDRRFIILGVVGLILLYFTLPDVILDRFLSIGNVKDSSTAYRLSIWLGTFAMLKDFWFTGIGPGTTAFNRVYPLYSYNTAAAQHSHNLYLQLMCDAGVSGIVVFLIILFTFFRTLCIAISKEKNKSSKALQIAAVSSATGFLVHGFADHLFYNYRVTLVFWAVLGLGLLIARRGTLSDERASVLTGSGHMTGADPAV